MSFFRNRTKEKEKESVMMGKKHQFYVQFLGWIECRGLRGPKYTDPIVDDLRRKQRKWKSAPKLTLQVNKKELKISQDVEEQKKKKKIKTIKFPLIPTRDITYVKQTKNPIDGTADDIVACIYLGYVPRTQRYVHVHVYRFDTAATAQSFVRFLNLIIDSNMERINRAEQTLIEQGEIEDPRLGSSDGMSDPHTNTDSAADSAASTYSGSQPSSDEFMDPDVQSLFELQPFDSVTDELKHRLNLSQKSEGPPLLLPPKDYDTIRRAHGNLNKADIRKCLQLPIVGEAGLAPPKSPESSRPRNESGESGIELDIPSPTDSEKRVPSIPEEEDEPLSAIDYSYQPPNSARTSGGTPRRSGSGYDRHAPMRQQSMSSAYSSHSYRSDASSHHSGSYHSNEQTLVNGKGPLDHPPADYHDDEPVVMRRGPMHSKRDLSKSLSGNSFHSDVDRDMGLHRSMPASVLRHTVQNGYGMDRPLDLHKSAPSNVLRHSVQNGVGLGRGMDMQRNSTPPPNVLRHSMQNGAEYAVVNKFNRQSANATPQYVDVYAPRSQDFRVRRVNSMYK